MAPIYSHSNSGHNPSRNLAVNKVKTAAGLKKSQAKPLHQKEKEGDENLDHYSGGGGEKPPEDGKRTGFSEDPVVFPGLHVNPTAVKRSLELSNLNKSQLDNASHMKNSVQAKVVTTWRVWC